MLYESKKIQLGLKLSAVVFSVLLATGCASSKSKSKNRVGVLTVGEAAARADKKMLGAYGTNRANMTNRTSRTSRTNTQNVSRYGDGMLRSWTVARGNHLWGIAARDEVYNVPEKWPLIYKANRDKIKDPDLIYPGQVLDIPRDSSSGEIDAAIKHARTRGAWAVGPIEATDKRYLYQSED